MKLIYLDYNATTPVAPSVAEAMLPFYTEHYGNPSSSHSMGRAGQEALEDARILVAALIGADRDEIVFTSGGTESNNLAIKGLLMAQGAIDPAHVVISGIEHPSVVQPVQFLQRLGCEVSVVNCDWQGVVDARQIEQALQPHTRLVSVMHANNEVGTVQPIAEISRLCREHSVLLHTDAAQSVGKIPTMVDQLGVDLMTIAGHKLYVPKGVGALYVREGIELEAQLHGAGQERGLRSGTENVAGIVGLGHACRLAARAIDDTRQQTQRLRDRLEELLRVAVGDRLVIHGARAERLPNTTSVAFPGVAAVDLLKRVPELCASLGSACHTADSPVSGTLADMGVGASVAASTIRLSLGWNTSGEEIDRAASLLIQAWEDLS